MYFQVPIVNGEMDIDYSFLLEGIGVSDTNAYVKLRDGCAIRRSWQEITEVEFMAAKPIPNTVPASETTEEKLARLEEQNLILMDALATTFEEVLTLRAIVEGGTV